CVFFLFFFNDTATTEIYTLSLHDALPISEAAHLRRKAAPHEPQPDRLPPLRSEEHTSELQSHSDLVCRLLLEKKTHCRRAPRGGQTRGSGCGGRAARAAR